MKNLFTKIFIALSFSAILLPGVTTAQPFVDLLNVKGQFFPSRPYIKDSNSKLSVKQYQGTFMLPMEQKNKDVILFGGDATMLNFTTSGNSSMTSNLYSTSLAIGYEKQWKNEKWKTMFLAIPKINSDYKDISGKDFQMGGVVMFNYKKKETLKYHFGMYYNRECFGDFFIPLVGIDWKINDKLILYGDIPVSLNLEYKLGKSLYTGATFYSTVASYRLSESTGDMYVRDGDKTLGHNEIKLFVNAYITKHIVWFLEGGQTFTKMYQLYNANNELVEGDPIYQRNLDGMFFNTGLAFRFRLDDEK